MRPQWPARSIPLQSLCHSVPRDDEHGTWPVTGGIDAICRDRLLPSRMPRGTSRFSFQPENSPAPGSHCGSLSLWCGLSKAIPAFGLTSSDHRLLETDLDGLASRHMYIRMHTCSCIHTCVEAHIHLYAHIHTYRHTYMCMQSYSCIHTCKQVYIHVYAHMQAGTCIQASTHTDMSMHTHPLRHTNTYMHTCACTHMRQTHICLYAHMCIHTHAGRHTNICMHT